jgi:signal transduction histidine kinase
VNAAANANEPLSRAWDTPRHWILSLPLLREGGNTLPIRVSGVSVWRPGLGPVVLDSTGRVNELYERSYLLRHDLPIFVLSIVATLGCLFLGLWAMRREEAAYGWFGLMSLAWVCRGFNLIATSPLPLPTTDARERFVAIASLAFCVSFAMFVLRYCGRRLANAELSLWAGAALGTLAILVASPDSIGQIHRDTMMLAGMLVVAICAAFIALACFAGAGPQRFLAGCSALLIAPALHDALAFAGFVSSASPYWAVSWQLIIASMSVLLAGCFVVKLQRTERFNDLHYYIEAAREEIVATLRRQHETQLANARLGERVRLAHDLHDGLGGTLVSSIATLEHSPEDIPAERFLSILKELRDDLRIIIDTASSRQLGENSLVEVIAPLRHRLTRLFESSQIECHWRIADNDEVFLCASRNIDVMRMLQEALTNVLKHSGASRVDVELNREHGQLQLSVTDNGSGFDVAAVEHAQGTGMRSMKNRVHRLGGTLTFRSSAEGTSLNFCIPLDPEFCTKTSSSIS